MAVNHYPVNWRTYYKAFVTSNEKKIEESEVLIEQLEKEVEARHKTISDWVDDYIKKFNFNPNAYPEFKKNKYSNGSFYRAAKGLVLNKDNDYELVGDLFYIYDLADKQKEIYDLKKKINFYEKCANITIKEYNRILKIFYTEVHKKLVLEGKGYVFSGKLGWICVARCTFDTKHYILDWVATRKKTKEILDSGGRIYNKDEADWCVRNGLQYDGQDRRVFTYNEYCYQIPLINCQLPNFRNIVFKIADYRHKDLRGKTNEDLIELCGGDTNKICELSVDLRAKVTLCDKADKLLYTKFIRNENQKPFVFTKTRRKNR